MAHAVPELSVSGFNAQHVCSPLLCLKEGGTKVGWHWEGEESLN